MRADRPLSPKLLSRLFLTGVLAAGLFFRFYHLDRESLWLDEGYTVDLVRQSLAQILGGLSQDLHPPVYGILLHGWVGIFGDSEFALRSFSALFGFLLIPLLYKLTRRFFDGRSARYAALLVSLSTFHVYYSQEARSYTLTAFLATLSFYFFIRMLEEEKRTNGIGYILATTLLLYTHSFGVLTVVAQNCLFFWRHRFHHRSDRMGLSRWMGLQALLVLLWFPWIYITLNQTHSIGKESWIVRPTLAVAFEALRSFSGGYKLLIFYTACIFWALWDMSKKKESAKGSTLLLWGVTVFFVPLAVSLVWTPVFVPRYMIVATVPFLVLVARGLAAVPHPPSRVVLLAALMALCLNSLHLNDRRIDKEQWREVTRHIETYAKPGELVIIQSAGTPVISYYLKRDDLELRVFPAAANKTVMLFDWAESQVSEANIHEITDMAAGRGRVWLLQSHNFGEVALVDKTLKDLYGAPVFYQKYEGVILSLYGATHD